MDDVDNILSPESIFADDNSKSLRPKKLSQFIGQKTIVENLSVFIKSAKIRKEPLDHILLSGPPGLGKTTLATIIANEMETEITSTSAPILDKAGDLASILTSLNENDVLFIDEIHRLSPAIEEILYPAMEDKEIDILIGQGVGAKSIKISLANFTLIGATTRSGLLTAAFRDRFGIPLRLNYYTDEELHEIVSRSANLLGFQIEERAAAEIAMRSRRTPRIVNRLLRRVADFSLVKGDGTITLDIAQYALEKLEIDNLGLDLMDRNILKLIIEKYNGGPVGIKTIAISVGEEVDTLEDYYEPFLVQSGLIKRTQRGRMVTESAFKHLKMEINTNIEDTLF